MTRLPIRIQFHFFFWLLFAGAVITGQFQQLLMLFAIVLAHELGHIFVATYFHWRITKLTVLPFGGVVEIDPPGHENAREEFWITLAGPLVNVILIIFAQFLALLGLLPYPYANQFSVGNGAIALFNLLPIYPLDGGRLCQIALSLRLPFRRAIVVSLYMSLCFIALMCLLSIWPLTLGIQIWLILPYLVIMIILELRRTPYRFLTFLLTRHAQGSNKLQRTSYVDVASEQTVRSATEQMFRHRYHFFRKFDQQSKKRKYFGEERILATMFETKKPMATFAELEKNEDFIDIPQ